MQRNLRQKIYIILSGFLIFTVFAFGEFQKKGSRLSAKSAILYAAFALAFCLFVTLLQAKQAAVRTFTAKLNAKLPSPNLKFVLPLYIITWGMMLLACFPGVFSYDCPEEYQMVLSGNITSHHPVLHVLLLGKLCAWSVKLTENANAGMLCYVIIQALVYALVFLHGFQILKKYRMSSLIQWMTALFWWLSPVVNMFILCASKDALFAIIELDFLLNVYVLSREKVAFFSEKRNVFLLAAASLGTMIFRKNGVYVVILTFAGILLIEKALRRLLLKTILSVAVLYLIYVGPFYAILQVRPGSSVEMLSVPLQQMARVYKFNSARMSAEEITTLRELVSEEGLNNYRTGCADAVKNFVNKDALAENPVKYAKLWVALALKNPNTYLNAFWLNTVDFWYPLTTYNGYGDLYGLDIHKSNYYDYRALEPCREQTFIHPIYDMISYLSTDLDVTTHVFPSVLLNSGWYILLWGLMVLRDLRERKNKMLHVHSILFWSLLTVLAGPMALVRYVLIFYLAAPLLIAFSD